MNATTFKRFPFEQMIKTLKNELDLLGIQHHISHVTYPPIPDVDHAYFSGGSRTDLLDFIEDIYPVICLRKVHDNVLYLSFLARVDWLEQQNGA